MSGVITSIGTGGSVHIAYFEEDVTAGRIRLAAAAVWRPSPTPPHWTLRRLFRRLRSYFGPLGMGLHLKGTLRPWTGSAGAGGEQETLYDPERRVVRVLGRDYPLPDDDRALVLLIDEGARAARKPEVVVRGVALPDVARGEAAIPPWLPLLQRDAVVREFLDRCGAIAVG